MATFTVNATPRSSGVYLLPSSGVIVPANARSATVEYVMPIDAERASTESRMEFSIDLSSNNGATWKPYLMAGWQGGTGFVAKNSTVLNPPPSATLGGEFFGAYAGQKVRTNTQLYSPMRLGLTVTVL